MLTVGKSYAFRDYFHGRARRRKSNRLRKVHADPSSRTSPAGFWGPTAATSSPCRSRSGTRRHKHVIGVLGRSIEIGSLLDEYGRAIFEETPPSGRRSKVSREIALLERVQGNLLDHTWFDKNDALMKSHPLTTAKLDSLRVSDRLRAKLQRLSPADGVACAAGLRRTTSITSIRSASSSRRRPTWGANGWRRLPPFRTRIGSPSSRSGVRRRSNPCRR